MTMSKAYLNSQLVNQHPSFGFDLQNTSGLNFGLFAGSFFNADTNVARATVDTVITLTDNTVNWVYCDTTQTPPIVDKLTSSVGPGHTWMSGSPTPQAGWIPLWKITTSNGQITNIVDKRSTVQTPDFPEAETTIVETSNITYTIPTDFTTINDFLSFMNSRLIAPGVVVTLHLPSAHTETSGIIWSHPQSSQIKITGAGNPSVLTLTGNVTLPIGISDSGTARFYVPSGNALWVSANLTITNDLTAHTYLLYIKDSTLNVSWINLYDTRTSGSTGSKIISSTGRANFVSNAGYTNPRTLEVNDSNLVLSSQTGLPTILTNCRGILTATGMTCSPTVTKTIVIKKSNINLSINPSGAAFFTGSPVSTLPSPIQILDGSDVYFETDSSQLVSTANSGTLSFITVEDSTMFASFECIIDANIVHGVCNVINASNSQITVKGPSTSRDLYNFTGTDHFVYGTNKTTMIGFDYGNYTGTGSITRTNLIGSSTANGIDLTNINAPISENYDVLPLSAYIIGTGGGAHFANLRLFFEYAKTFKIPNSITVTLNSNVTDTYCVWSHPQSYNIGFVPSGFTLSFTSQIQTTNLRMGMFDGNKIYTSFYVPPNNSFIVHDTVRIAANPSIGSNNYCAARFSGDVETFKSSTGLQLILTSLTLNAWARVGFVFDGNLPKHDSNDGLFTGAAGFSIINQCPSSPLGSEVPMYFINTKGIVHLVSKSTTDLSSVLISNCVLTIIHDPLFYPLSSTNSMLTVYARCSSSATWSSGTSFWGFAYSNVSLDIYQPSNTTITMTTNAASLLTAYSSDVRITLRGLDVDCNAIAALTTVRLFKAIASSNVRTYVDNSVPLTFVGNGGNHYVWSVEEASTNWVAINGAVSYTTINAYNQLAWSALGSTIYA